jgi:hypothetical protein
LHIRPINHVVYVGSLGSLCCGRRHLEGGWEDSYLSSVKKINKATSPRFSRTGGGAPDASKTEALCQPFNPISERVDSRVVGAPARPKKYFHIFSIGGLSKREENPPQGLHQRLWAHLRHRGALKISKNLMHAPPSQSRNLNLVPFRYWMLSKCNFINSIATIRKNTNIYLPDNSTL